ncbi:hypothetical protein LCGC14_1983960 [marine sediment metagenome]|uniref:Uncharacterized protein n=1 Tax=marine sediment metagenome TaxID=412755 RepID=A0A0F9HLA5_9ZZZZ
MPEAATKRYPMIEFMKRGPFDEIPTPFEALAPLLPHLPRHWTLWEVAPGSGMLTQWLVGEGYKVQIVPELFPSFNTAPEHDAIVTNPPFSKKVQFLKHVEANGKPWALLLPVTTFGVGSAQPYLEGAEVLFFKKRIDFTGKGAPWFAVAWFTKGLNIGKQLVFDA